MIVVKKKQTFEITFTGPVDVEEIDLKSVLDEIYKAWDI